MTNPPLIDQPRRVRTTANGANLEQWQLVLDEVMNLLQISDADLAAAVGVSRQSIHGRRTGKFASIKLNELQAMADAIGIPITLFHGTTKEAIEWILENYPQHFP